MSSFLETAGKKRDIVIEEVVVPLCREMPHYLDDLATYERAGFQLVNLSVVSRIPEGGLQELNCLMKRGKE